MTIGSFNELQLTLLGAGLIAVAGVWGYNLWQERKHRQLAQRVFRGAQSDVLMHDDMPARVPEEEEAQHQEGFETCVEPEDELLSVTSPRTYKSGGEPERIEPVFIQNEDASSEDHEAVVDGSTEAAPESVAVPVTESVAHGSPVKDPVVNPVEHAIESEPPAELADTLVDCIVHLNAANLVSAPLFWAAQRQLLGRLAGRLRWSGLDENSGKWQQLHAHDATSYRRLTGALQLADRSGPINAADITLFCDGVRQLAVHYQVQVVVPVVADVLACAVALDEFCAAVDWRIGINLVHRNGLSLPLVGVKQLATAAALRLADDGIFHAEDSDGRELFTVSSLGGAAFANEDVNLPTTPGVTLIIDVPRVADGSAAFDKMLGIARHMMVALDAVLVDDQRKPLSDEVIAVIRSKIGEFQQKMAAHQIPAGGRRALRLYS